MSVSPVVKQLENEFRNHNIELIAYTKSDMANSRFRVSWRYEGMEGSVLHYEEEEQSQIDAETIPEEDQVSGQSRSRFMVYWQDSDCETVRVDTVAEVIDKITQDTAQII